MKERERISELTDRVTKVYITYKKFLLKKNDSDKYTLDSYIKIDDLEKTLAINMCLSCNGEPMFNYVVNYQDPYEFSCYICEKLLYEILKVDYEYGGMPLELHLKVPESYKDKKFGFVRITNLFINDKNDEIDDYLKERYRHYLTRKLVKGKKVPIIRKNDI